MKTAKPLGQLEQEFLERYSIVAERNNLFDPSNYEKYNVKRGLRNSDGSGVVVGLTEIGEVHGYIIDEGEKTDAPGRLRYRGYDIKELVADFQNTKRNGFEETVFLLLFATLPNSDELEDFTSFLASLRKLPPGFVEDVILRFPSPDIMNQLARSVLFTYSFDPDPENYTIKNILRQSVELIARFPIYIAYSYQAKRHYYDKQSLSIHHPRTDLSTAANFLYMIRPDNQFTPLEAETLDLALVLHAEHGGGNNSTFAIRLVTSAGTDTYSAMGSAIGSLKGIKHGGANIRVMRMIDDIRANCPHWDQDGPLADYLEKIVRKQAFDEQGLIYGMGHAVYTLSDPRAQLLKAKAAELAKEKGLEKNFHLYQSIERLTPEVMLKVKGSSKAICANVDLYSGFVYEMLGLPRELYTPIFAMSRVAGWSAHRIEEIVSGGRIIRPAYKNVSERSDYRTLLERP
ncbi:MAG: citrate/2-methylcitrate synthase [Spirochaetales bacterium]|nr:citrate/2-methylcitrate synthase [Spirochaetales bacterium]